MNKLYEVLEICLQDMEQGADIDTVLFRYPDLADELRPILEASKNASSMAIPVPSTDVVRRNRARVLQRAAELREGKVKQASRRFWFASFRRVAVTLVVVSILFASGTGLVRAASTTLPGDQLYPVKRTWEDVLVLLTFNLQQRDALEIKHENERLHELKELFAEKRFAEVEFAGLVTSQNGNEWMVAGIPVVISSQTEMHDQGIAVGSAVRVEGHTQDNGAVLAEKIKLLPSDAKVPDAGEEHEMEDKDDQELDQQVEDRAGEIESPKQEETEVHDSESKQESGSLDGSERGGDSESDDHNDSNDDSSKDDEDHHDDDHNDSEDSQDSDSSSGESSD